MLFSVGMSANSVNNIHFDGIYDLVGNELLSDVTGNLTAICNNGPSCDFSHTATIRLGLPAEVDFTSGSGVFLSAVPEPASGGATEGELGRFCAHGLGLEAVKY